ncbi:MAG TPA: hypothetical protein VN714_14965 [Trebonia sp.]|nr:hypothetical protein [Trebonia sp.]
MTAADIHAQALAWALDAAQKASLGEDFGVAVSWSPQIAQTPNGAVPVPAWHLLLTARSPLLSEGPMYHLVPIGAPVPTEDFTRKQVTDGISQLRALSRQKLSSANGHAKAAAGR